MRSMCSHACIVANGYAGRVRRLERNSANVPFAAVEPIGTDRGDGFLQELHAIDELSQFLTGGFVDWEIEGIYIGASDLPRSV